MCVHSAAIAFVVDQTFASVSRCHGRVRARSAEPPQRSTTTWPSTVAANDAPISFPTAKFFANASFTRAKRGSQKPSIETSGTAPDQMEERPVGPARAPPVGDGPVRPVVGDAAGRILVPALAAGGPGGFRELVLDLVVVALHRVLAN